MVLEKSSYAERGMVLLPTALLERRECSAPQFVNLAPPTISHHTDHGVEAFRRKEAAAIASSGEDQEETRRVRYNSNATTKYKICKDQWCKGISAIIKHHNHLLQVLHF